MSREIFTIAERYRRRRINGKQFLHIEDLDAVIYGLTADNHEVVLAPDFAPSAGR